MSRAAAGDTVVVKPQSNIYTVLAAGAVVGLVLALILLYVRAQTAFGGLLSGTPAKVTSPR
jgi:hypothetical protein